MQFLNQILFTLLLSLFTLVLLKLFHSRYFLKRKQSKKYSVLVLYGSQSGTAEDFAHDLARTLQRSFSSSILIELKCAGLVKEFQERLCSFDFIFILTATYGEGEPPLNAIAFHDFLLASLSSPKQPGSLFFKKTKFAVFGLGDSSYTYFNAFGKFCDRTCHKLGAERFLPIGLGDDYEENTREEYLDWKKELLDKLSHSINGSEWKKDGPIRKYSIGPFLQSQAIRSDSLETGQSQLGSHQFPLNCQVVNLENLDSGCIYNEIKISIPNCKASVVAGDHIVVIPENCQNSISRILERFSLGEEEVLCLKDEMTGEIKFNGTWKSFLTHFCDLNKPISQENLAYLKEQMKNEADFKFLQSLTTSYSNLVEKEHKNVAEVVLQLKQISVEDFVNCIEFIYPRYYSIVSSISYESLDKIDCTLLFKYINFTTPKGLSRSGLSTGYFMTFPEQMKIFISRSKFHLIKFVDRPIIMIANGTGIAPYVGFLEERIAQYNRAGVKRKNKFGEAILIYGCYGNEFFLYKEKFDQFKKIGVLSQIITAFSRDGTNQKEYVQDKLLQHKGHLFDLVSRQHAVVYICGDSHGMGKGVREKWLEVFQQEGQMSYQQSLTFLNRLIEDKQYLEDIY